MGFIIKGNFCGYLCRDCRESLSNVLVKVYAPQKEELGSDRIVANPKYTYKVLDEKAVATKEKYLLGQGKTDDAGNYEIALDKSYQGGPVVIDIEVSKVPGQKSEVDRTVQFTVTTLQPAWRGQGDDYYYSWKHCLSYQFWCAIRALFDAWVICGYIKSCEDNETPLVGVKVTAFDADWLTDDLLGTTTTDSSGYFRIDYSSIDFKQTFLSPIINVETPFSTTPGPDVYFVVESSGGTVIYEESRSDGLVAGRRDVPNCFCIELCVEITIPDPNIPASAWTGIGTQFTIPTGPFLNDFDVEGYAGSLRYGLTGNIRTTGQVAISSTNKAMQGNPYEYRFLISDGTTGINGNAPLGLSNFTKIVGVDSGLFASIKIGQMWYTGTPFKVVDVYAKIVDLDTEGWLDANKSVERTFIDDASLNPADLTDSVEGPKWHWIDLDGMMGIHTPVLTNSSMPSVGQPGDAVPPAQRKGIEKIAIRFELREVIDKATSNFNYLAGSGQTLNAAVVNNSPPVAELAVKQHLSGTACAALNGDIDMAYTAHHPELEDVSINIKSNDNVINVNLTGPGLPVTNNTNAALNHRNDASLPITQAPNNVVLKTCSYIATLRVKRRLHNGDGGVSANIVQKSFYYEAP
ncbi:MAG: hypothetical protein ACR2MT_08370 [Aurantibacter sp.]